MESLFKIKLLITPISQKNSKQIAVNLRTKQKFIRGSDKYIRNKQIAVKLVRLAWRNKPPLNCPLHIKITTAGKWHSCHGNLMDASNLYEFPQDVLQAAGVIADDVLIEHHDGSRRIKLCDDCDKFSGVYKNGRRRGKNCVISRCDKEFILIELFSLF